MKRIPVFYDFSNDKDLKNKYWPGVSNGAFTSLHLQLLRFMYLWMCVRCVCVCVCECIKSYIPFRFFITVLKHDAVVQKTDTIVELVGDAHAVCLSLLTDKIFNTVRN